MRCSLDGGISTASVITEININNNTLPSTLPSTLPFMPSTPLSSFLVFAPHAINSPFILHPGLLFAHPGLPNKRPLLPEHGPGSRLHPRPIPSVFRPEPSFRLCFHDYCVIMLCLHMYMHTLSTIFTVPNRSDGLPWPTTWPVQVAFTCLPIFNHYI